MDTILALRPKNKGTGKGGKKKGGETEEKGAARYEQKKGNDGGEGKEGALEKVQDRKEEVGENDDI